MSQINRRDFLKRGILGLGLTAVSISGLKSVFTGSAFAGSPAMLSEKDPVATTLGYHADGSKVDLKKWSKKAGADGKSQSCANCMFYTSADAKSGKCQIFPNNMVSSKGWCNSWAKKP